MVNASLKKLFNKSGVPAQPLVKSGIGGWVQTSALVGFGWFGIVYPAVAHHAMGGRTPTSFWEGLLSGLAHPVIGLDHLAFVVAIGLLSARQVRGAWLPLFFVVAAMLGTGLHVMAVNLPLTEMAIAVSVIALGVLLALGQQLSFPLLAGLAALAGLFHGYAYGEAIVGAEMAPLVAYLAGFTVIQYAIAFLAFWLGRQGFQQSPGRAADFFRYFGYGVSVIGVILLGTSLQGMG